MASAMDPVSAYFANTCHDWTSAIATQDAKVLFCPYAPSTDVTHLCASVLSNGELDRSGNFITPELTAAFIQRRAFRHYCASLALENPNSLADQKFQETESGRPYLSRAPEYCFSFSSCPQGFISAWSNTLSLGLDIEYLNQEIEILELSKQFFAPAEANLVEQEQDGEARKQVFFQLWCLKEAALKSIGEGLPFGMDKFQFAIQPTPHLLIAPSEHIDLQNMKSHLLKKSELVVALVTLRLDYKSCRLCGNADTV